MSCIALILLLASGPLFSPLVFPLDSGGVGQIDHRHLTKAEGEISHLVVKIGGPCYRIGMGGGAASSMASGSNNAELDFNAVQRGDAEMSQKLWRVVRSCVELGDKNPIVQIHDQVRASGGGLRRRAGGLVYCIQREEAVKNISLGSSARGLPI